MVCVLYCPLCSRSLWRNHHVWPLWPPASAASAGAAGTGATSDGAATAGLSWRLEPAALLGFAPSVRISVTRTSVNSCPCPRFRREFFLRRFLKAMTFGPRPCSRTSAATEAPEMLGAPRVTLSPPTTRTSPNWMISPGSPLTFSTLITSSATTRYCLPPVLMTANIVLSLCSMPMLGSFRIGFFQSIWAERRVDGRSIAHRFAGAAELWPPTRRLSRITPESPQNHSRIGMLGPFLPIQPAGAAAIKHGQVAATRHIRRQTTSLPDERTRQSSLRQDERS